MLFDDLRRIAPSAVAIGDFDGVHIGHAAIMHTLAAEAAKRGLSSAAITFDINTKHSRVLLCGSAKAELLIKHGAMHVLTLDFAAIKNVDAAIFAASLAASGVKCLVCGEGFRFGKDALGDIHTLYSVGIDIVVVPPVTVDGSPVSSTRIRQALEANDIGLAVRLLGREIRNDEGWTK